MTDHEKAIRDALADCPFCGCAATFVKHSAGIRGTQGFDSWDAVSCKHCRATVGACDRRFRDKKDAAIAWNLRIAEQKDAELQASRERVRVLEADVRRYRHIRAHGYVEVHCDSPRHADWDPVALDAAIDAAIEASQAPASAETPS